jgi:periplasmic protein TonB
MAPLTKDTTEVTNSAADANRLKSGSAAKTEQSGHSRADAVSLEVPVKVHGSRVTEVVREITPHTEPFEEQTSTMIVFPQGAVIRMSTAVSVGQMLVVTNLKSRQDAICRVVKVRTFSNLQGYVEVEFTHKQPGYWNVYFPSDGPQTANKPVPPVAAESATPAIKKTPDTAASEISWAPAAPEPVVPKPVELTSFSPATKPPTAVLPVSHAAKPEAPFISIGSQEEVQPAASVISGKPASPITSRVEVVKKPAPLAKSNMSSVLEFPPAPPAQTAMEALPADAGASSLASESLTEPAPEEAASSSAVARSTFGSLSGGATLGRGRSESPIVEPGLSSLEDAASLHKPSSGTNWILIAACIAVLFAAVIGGAIYFRGGSSGSGSRAANVPASAQTVEAVTTNTAQPPSTNPSPAPTGNSSGGATLKPSVVVNGNVPIQTHDAPFAANHAAAPAKPSEPRVTPDMMSATLNAHPVSSQRAADTGSDAAPTLDAMAPASASNSALPGMGSSDVVSPPAPAIRPDGPIKVGGQVKEPRLLASTLPIYPALAKQSNTQGDVVIKATVDKNGRVAHMVVVSGPIALRQAATEALGRWKYEPSKLNGQPVDVQMLITIKFRR